MAVAERVADLERVDQTPVSRRRLFTVVGSAVAVGGAAKIHNVKASYDRFITPPLKKF